MTTTTTKGVTGSSTNDDNNNNNDLSYLSSLPPCRLLVRSKTSLELFTCPPSYHHNHNNLVSETTTTNQSVVVKKKKNNGILLYSGGTSFQHIAPDGTAVYIHVNGKGIIKIPLASSPSPSLMTTPFFNPSKDVQIMSLSPFGTFAVTWERFKSSPTNSNHHNMKIWDCSTGTVHTSFKQKTLLRENWPYIQWTFDEKYIFILSQNSNQIRIYLSKDCYNDNNITKDNNNDQTEKIIEPRFIAMLPMKNCTSFSLPQTTTSTTTTNTSTTPPPITSYYFTTFTSVQRDKPACATVHEFIVPTVVDPTAASTTTSTTSKEQHFKVIASKSLFQAESCTTYWAPTNTAVLITLQTAVDTSGQSYYGQTQLFLWNTTNVKNRNEIIPVPLPLDGPISSVQWIPDPTKPVSFIVIAGPVPAMVTYHHGVTGVPLYQFGNDVARNTITFAPHGRFFVLAGLGNLSGKFGFWDMNKKKLIPAYDETDSNNNNSSKNMMGTLQMEAVTMYEWSPCSRYFVVATCSPRMNVDNNIRLFRYNGMEINSTNVPWDNHLYQPDQLVQVSFVPAQTKEQYPDRPQSPIPIRTTSNDNIETKDTSKNQIQIQKSLSTTATATGTIPKPTGLSSLSTSSTGKYVPPSARARLAGGGTSLSSLASMSTSSMNGNSLAERLRREKASTIQSAGKMNSQFNNKGPISALTGKAIVGLVEPSTTNATNSKAAKNKALREKQKLKKQREQPSTTTITSTGGGKDGTIENGTVAATASAAVVVEKTITTTTTTPVTTITTTTTNTSIEKEEIEKKVRKIKKLLKQVDDIKKKEYHTLNPDQIKKLATEQELIQELNTLTL